MEHIKTLASRGPRGDPIATPWCHDDTETSAFNVNIRLLMF